MLQITDTTHCHRILSQNPNVLIKFSAEWCGPCKAVAPAIEKMANSFPNVFFGEVDVDKANDVAAEYQVTSMPTFVIFKSGVEIERVIGGDVSKLQQILRSLPQGPSFGKGQKIGGKSTQLSAEELRELRARRFQKAPESDENKEDADDKASSTDNEKQKLKERDEQNEKLAKSKTKSTSSTSKLPTEKAGDAQPRANPLNALTGLGGGFATLVFFIKLYFLTLFSFDARSQALKLARERNS